MVRSPLIPFGCCCASAMSSWSKRSSGAGGILVCMMEAARGVREENARWVARGSLFCVCCDEETPHEGLEGWGGPEDGRFRSRPLSLFRVSVLCAFRACRGLWNGDCCHPTRNIRRAALDAPRDCASCGGQHGNILDVVFGLSLHCSAQTDGGVVRRQSLQPSLVVAHALAC